MAYKIWFRRTTDNYRGSLPGTYPWWWLAIIRLRWLQRNRQYRKDGERRRARVVYYMRKVPKASAPHSPAESQVDQSR